MVVGKNKNEINYFFPFCHSSINIKEILEDKQNNAKGEESDYIHKKMSLAYSIWHMADAYESYHLYEKFLELIKDIIIKSRIFDLHGSLVMALLSMDRDDEAFALLKVGNDFDIAGKIHNWKVRFQI